MFVPVYLRDGTHPYHHSQDELPGEETGQPLDRDAKQLVPFRNAAVSDSGPLSEAMNPIRGSCSKKNLARVYSAINPGE
ncbi:hypothetical protein [Salinactinospora qingdaonensis]|uniref:Uncharacterized protein n=1 Tax=Salinactinospora qingdaonensis TaxID=702744 RepID=A0ABP7FS19_9ACTN